MNEFKVQCQIFERDNEFLGKIRKKHRLDSRAAALEMIIRKIKYLKVEDELR